MNSVSAFLVDVSLRVVSRSVLQSCRGLRWPLHAALEVMYHKLVSQNSQLKTDHAAGEKRLSRKDQRVHQLEKNLREAKASVASSRCTMSNRSHKFNGSSRINHS